MRDIIFSANNNEEIIILPVVPDIPMTRTQENERFKVSGKGYLNLIGEMGLREFSISSYLPSQKIPSMRPGSIAEPFKYIDFFNKWRDEKVPIRVVASRPNGKGGSREWFNMAILVDNLEYTLLGNGSIEYSLECSEYPFWSDLI